MGEVAGTGIFHGITVLYDSFWIGTGNDPVALCDLDICWKTLRATLKLCSWECFDVSLHSGKVACGFPSCWLKVGVEKSYI